MKLTKKLFATYKRLQSWSHCVNPILAKKFVFFSKICFGVPVVIYL